MGLIAASAVVGSAGLTLSVLIISCVSGWLLTQAVGLMEPSEDYVNERRSSNMMAMVSSQLSKHATVFEWEFALTLASGEYLINKQVQCLERATPEPIAPDRPARRL